MEKFQEWTRYNVLGVGILGYEIIINHLVRYFNALPEAENNKKNLRFLNFFDNAKQAWQSAQSTNYDIYFIDCSVDKQVTGGGNGNIIGGRLLSDAIKELYPNTLIIGLSVQDYEVRREGHNFDELFNPRHNSFDEIIVSYLKSLEFLD